jgi:hypothetical protein
MEAGLSQNPFLLLYLVTDVMSKMTDSEKNYHSYIHILSGIRAPREEIKKILASNYQHNIDCFAI